MGQKTMGLLENQGESIENWEEVADKINEDMKMAEKALKDMDRACFGFIPRFWKVSFMQIMFRSNWLTCGQVLDC